MPRKKPEDLVAEDKTFENEAKKSDAKVVVPASEAGVSKKVKLDLEVDTSVKDSGSILCKNYSMARAVDSWRIFPVSSFQHTFICYTKSYFGTWS